ncbi:MAG: class I SAM-dependent methyltransferase [Treponema sp.]|nr:class I SAM-dependent methyltransferase [Treponema sp.]
MKKTSVEESIITALDGSDVKLVQYLPYILQDFWEMGTPPEDIIDIIRRYTQHYTDLYVLDLGSGKGAVSIQVALALQCTCLGIDALEDFVVFSNDKAREYCVHNICTFETHDIRERLTTLGAYNVIILGAIGPVFGDYYYTLKQLEPHLKDNGIIIINDACIEDDSNDHPVIQRKCDILQQAENAGMQVLEIITDDTTGELESEYRIELQNLTKRCMELAAKYPEDRDLFHGYIEKQTREYEILNNEIVPALFVFGKNRDSGTHSPSCCFQ